MRSSGIPATNYCAKILEQEARVSKAHSMAFGASSQFKQWHRWYRALESGIKFKLPDNGRILGLDIESARRALGEFRGLPYPTTVLEYKAPDSGFSEHPGTRGFVLAVHQNAGWEENEIFAEAALFVVGDEKAGDTTPWISANLSYTKEDGARFKPVLGRFPNQNIRHEFFQTEFSFHYSILAELLAALACRNIKQEDVPPPKRLNKKRERSGKKPFHSYKILVIDGHESNSADLGGTHASPRVHLRRGHIRRLPKGNIWVNAAVVGDKSKGMVSKDYQLTDRAA